jgi:hypothetical protein
MALMWRRRSPGGPERALARWAVAPAALGLVLAMAIATWWLVGDLSTVPLSASPDYAIRPWRISPAAARAAGIGSLVVAAVTMAVLGWATLRRVLEVRWWVVLVALLAAGFIAGAGWRVMTAGVIGANIGAGFVILLGGPIFVALVVWALANSVHLLSRANHARTVSTPSLAHERRTSHER